MKTQLIVTTGIALLVFTVDNSAAMGLLRGLGLYGNPMLGAAGCGCGCGCGYPPQMYGLASGLALSKTPSIGLGYPSTCCLSLSKPCLLTKLYLLKKKLMEKKMSLMGCGCGKPPLCCAMM